MTDKRTNKELDKKEKAPEGMSGLAKGLAVIEAFNEKGKHMTIAEISRATNLSRATARRCLLTLTDCGYLFFDGKYFQPAPRIMKLGASYRNVATLPQIAQPFLETARASLNESVSIAILEDENSVFIARAEADHIVTIGLRVGTHLPAYSCATGRVLLSAYSNNALYEYLHRCAPEARTPQTLTNKLEIQHIIESVHETNFATTDEELELGMRSIATPVRKKNGEIVAAMSASTYANRVSQEEMINRFLPVLIQQARHLANAL